MLMTQQTQETKFCMCGFDLDCRLQRIDMDVMELQPHSSFFSFLVSTVVGRVKWVKKVILWKRKERICNIYDTVDGKNRFYMVWF